VIRCPQCDREMNEVVARANPGQMIILDQCPKCGGIWCDKWELFPIQAEEASRLEPADEQALREPQPIDGKKTLYCPRCTAQLLFAKDPALPPDLQLRRCLKCDGIWLNRGQFTRFKAQQQKVRVDKLGRAELAGKLTEVIQNPKAWVVTGTKGMFAYPRGEEESNETIQDSVRNATKLVLQTLARMLIGI
jgi:Zn-finger nucleic acid-binding protein